MRYSKAMKRSTMKLRILTYNILVILGFMALTTIVFNISIKLYIEKDISDQLHNIAIRAEDTALNKGPDFLPMKGDPPPPKHDNGAGGIPPSERPEVGDGVKGDDIFKFYFLLDRSLRETLSVLNADYILIDSDKNVINTPAEGYFDVSQNLLNRINSEFSGIENVKSESKFSFNLSGTDYISIIKPVSHKNSFGLGWIVIYSSLQKVNQLQLVINLMLLIILVLSSIIAVFFSSMAAKKISSPFSYLNKHLSEIAKRNFGAKLDLNVDDELKELIANINYMTQKLEIYDKAQKTFFQNASHEFRTPLMSIQSYAEGIKYDVIDTNTAISVILEETKRMTNLVEDLVYLSRLDNIEESYRFTTCNLCDLISSCANRMNRIAFKSNITIVFNNLTDNVMIRADEEKMSRAVNNIISNDIRYAESKVIIDLEKTEGSLIKLSILDDGPGFAQDELPNIFDRFYKGKKGNFGLGLAIARNVIEKHNGNIKAINSEKGALFIIELPLLP